VHNKRRLDRRIAEKGLEGLGPIGPLGDSCRREGFGVVCLPSILAQDVLDSGLRAYRALCLTKAGSRRVWTRGPTRENKKIWSADNIFEYFTVPSKTGDICGEEDLMRFCVAVCTALGCVNLRADNGATLWRNLELSQPDGINLDGQPHDDGEWTVWVATEEGVCLGIGPWAGRADMAHRYIKLKCKRFQAVIMPPNCTHFAIGDVPPRGGGQYKGRFAMRVKFAMNSGCKNRGGLTWHPFPPPSTNVEVKDADDYACPIGV
jgi:hypothetical protein